MDETLIHCLRDFTRAPRRCDFVAEVAAGVGPTDGLTLYHIYKRPHVDLFLKTVHQWYTVVVFTAAVKDYANPILDQLDPSGELFDNRLFREVILRELLREGRPLTLSPPPRIVRRAVEYSFSSLFFSPHPLRFRPVEFCGSRVLQHCTTVAESTYKKGLEQIEPDLRDVCIVDNNDASFVTPENGIPISDYLGGAEDEALSELIPFLDALRFTDDVRNVLSLRLVG
ncbi:MAG: HAD-like domain-containing protein [Olpidium bornovanus]|uniref:Mitochondrial import inner membrane translocase subunit TIM50 n=1 Tax=Olpidium bornovanus TaxID=278681 RepID=A0A8H7ZRJ3_9FUNG|nr:MAG: HAD-like domain-containing protein [Olpidium bornovanus]